MPQQIQVAFQGGGARFVEMLPFAHALSDAHGSNVTITRVAGSSAGSICAALVATRADFGKVRDYVVDHGPGRVKKMRRWCTRTVKDSPSRLGKIVKAPVKFSKTSVALYRAMRGKSLLNTPVLNDFLTALFAHATGKYQYDIADFGRNDGGIALLITGSDLQQSTGVVFSSGNLLAHIVHSSAIPFAFRSFRDIAVSPIVDGGLCENLPVDPLMIDEATLGPVFCVSLADQTKINFVPKGISDYCSQLISASMNHNVLRAKRRVGASNVFEAQTAIDTFDFEQAIAQLDDDEWYGKRYRAAEAKIRGIAELYSSVQSRPRAERAPSNLSGRPSAPKVMNSLFQVFDNWSQSAEWDYPKSAFVVRAECLQPPDSRSQPREFRRQRASDRQQPGGQPVERLRPADHVVRIATIKAKAPSLVCFASSAALNPEGSIVPTKWTCYNETQKRNLPIQPIPVRKSGETDEKLIDVLIFFQDPKTAVALDDEISIRSYYLQSDAMIGLAEERKTDWIHISNPHRVPIIETDIVLVYPSQFGHISPVGTNREPLIKEDVIRAQYLTHATEGYEATGCTATNLLPGAVFHVDFYKNT